MRLERVGNLALAQDPSSGGIVLVRDLGSAGHQVVGISSDDLRWLCLVAGPALLNELDKEITDD